MNAQKKVMSARPADQALRKHTTTRTTTGLMVNDNNSGHQSPAITAEQIAQALDGRRSGSKWEAKCPTHDDKKRSLSLSTGDDDKILVHCHAGCTQDTVVTELKRRGLWPSSKSMKPAKNGSSSEWVRWTHGRVYHRNWGTATDEEWYHDADGKEIYSCVRFEPKNFRQGHFANGKWEWNLNGVDLVLWRLPEVLDAAKNNKIVAICEGEKDARNLHARFGVCTTTLPMGANKPWQQQYAAGLTGARVVIFPDKDKPDSKRNGLIAGFKHANTVAEHLLDAGIQSRVVVLPGPGKDVTDWLDAGGTADQLKALIKQTQPWTPKNKLADQEVSQIWPELKPLMREMPPPETFPTSALCEPLKAAAEELSRVIQAPAAICGQSVLAAACLAVQGHANISIEGRRHPISEYFVSVAESGERKSAVDNHALWPHRRHQEKLAENYDRLYHLYVNDKESYDAARDTAIKSNRKNGRDAMREALEKIGSAPIPPLMPMLILEEPTYEGLVKLLATGRPSVGLFSAEGGRLIGGHAMNTDNQLKTATGLSGLWDGTPIDRVRGGDGAAVLYGRRVSMHLMLQPKVASLLLANTLLLDQGLLSRCLVTAPATTAGQRPYKEIDLSTSEALKKYSAKILSILEEPLPVEDGRINQLKPRDLPLSADAKRLWISFHNLIENGLAPNGPYEPVRGLASKIPEHALRIAGVLALVENLNCTAVSVDHIASGIDLATHYLTEALRLFHAGSTDPKLAEAERLLGWLTAKQKDVVTLVEIYRFGPNSIRTAKVARELMEVLHEHGYVMPLAGGAAFEGAVRKEGWRLRPAT